MKLRIGLFGAVCASLVALPALAQMSVTTFGATEAAGCFENARGSSSDTGPCDAALARGLTKSDEKKTLVNRGIIYNRRLEVQRAREDFEAAMEIDPNLAEAYLNRGNSFLLAGRTDAALEDYQDSLSLGVSEPWAAWYNIGLVYEAKSDPAKAREAYAKAIELYPGFPEATAKLAALGPA
jgi:tetratricopeptide (TPR) repeat protein